MSHLHLRISHIKEKNRVITIAYKIDHDSLEDNIQYAACIFRKEKDDEFWVKKNSYKTAVHRFNNYPLKT